MPEVRVGKHHVALVDEADLERVTQFNWWLHRNRSSTYALAGTRSNGTRSCVLMHRLILQPPDDVHVDHINGDGLDNRRCNLRVVTPAENQQNRRGASRHSKTGVRGVRWDESIQRFRASVRVSRKQVFSAAFRTLAEAEVAVKQARAVHMTHSSECDEKRRPV